MNLLDYMDRNILSAVLSQIVKPRSRGGLDIPIDRAGWLPSFFLASYTVFGLVMGYAADRMRRTLLLGLGVGLWSLATVGSGFAQSFGFLALARSLLGIGEATYGIIAPTILVDLFAREQRARVLSAFYLAMPLGSALGIIAGGLIGERYGWRMAFFVVGVPGLIAAMATALLPEPVRGASEGVDPERLREHERAGPSAADYRDLMVNSSYTYSVLGMAFYTFAIGGLVLWIPYFLINTRGLSQGRATLILGGVTLAAASTGMLIGGWVSDRLAKKTPRALFLVPGLAMLASIPFVLVGLFSQSPPWIFAGIFCAEALMFVNTGPCNAIIANVIAPNMRGSAYAIALAAVHVFGDFWSPPLIGWVARTFGQPDTMATSFGRWLGSLGAVPVQPEGQVPENIVAGLLVVVPALLLSGLVLLSGARHLPREMALMLARLKAAPENQNSPQRPQRA
ncbi:MAG: MFS transporter [Isosphaeraceae bacterium]|nr:MFS transporter [Isosphaeraceae bacterium]